MAWLSERPPYPYHKQARSQWITDFRVYCGSLYRGCAAKLNRHGDLGIGKLREAASGYRKCLFELEMAQGKEGPKEAVPLFYVRRSLRILWGEYCVVFGQPLPELPDCVICYEAMRPDNTWQLPCQHSFHVGCMATWSTTAPQPTKCPTCRGSID